MSGARRCDCMSSILHSLHWLPISQRGSFKIALFVWKCVHGAAPTYMQEFLCPGRRRPRAHTIDLGANRKRMCDFLLVTNIVFSNIGLSPTVSEILTLKARKWLVFPSLPCLTPTQGEPVRIFG